MSKPQPTSIVVLREEVLKAAWRGAVAALDAMTDAEVRLVSHSDDIAGRAAQWLLEYRRRDTERRQRVQVALRVWRQDDGSK